MTAMLAPASACDHLALAQARGVVFKGDLIFPFVMAEAAQAVYIGEFAKVGGVVRRVSGDCSWKVNSTSVMGGIIPVSANLKNIRMRFCYSRNVTAIHLT